MDLQGHAGQQAEAAGHMDQQVAEPGGLGFPGAPVPDEEDRTDGQQFPEHEQGQEVPGKHHPQGAAGVDHAGHLFQIVLDVQGIDGAQEGD